MRFPELVTCARLRWIVPLAALAGYAFCCLFLWAESEWRPEWDGALYILVGRSLALGEGYRYLGEPFLLRPPGMPWLISLLFPDGVFDPAVMNRVLMGFAATAVAAIWFSVRVQYGTWIALGVALLVGTNPVFVRLFNFVFTEFPFLTLLFLSFGCLQFAARRSSSWVLWALAGALTMSAAFYVRAVTLLALPGVLLVGLTQDRGRQRWRALLPLAVIGVLLLPWELYAWAATLVAEVPEDQLLAFDYSSIAFRVDPGDPASRWLSGPEWMERIDRNGLTLLGEITTGTLGEVATVAMGGSSRWLQAGLVVVWLCGFGWAVRWRASIQEWFALAYTALVVTYFVYSFRLVTPLLPFTYLYVLAAIAAFGGVLARRWPRLRPGASLPAVAFVLMFSANLWALPNHLDLARWGSLGTRLLRSYGDIQRLSVWIKENTPPDATLMCSRAPVQSVLTGRTAYTYRFLHRFPSEPMYFERYQPDYVFFDIMIPESFKVQRRVATRFDLLTRLDSSYGPESLLVYAPPPGAAPR